MHAGYRNKMATYAIGDIQGCFASLQQLLAKIHFNPAQDTLWFTGDLVNRGPHSLETLRFVKSLGEKQITVLGNHDLHLLAVACGAQQLHEMDTLLPVLNAPDKNELLAWLRFRPLLHVDAETGFVMSHAGLASRWSVQQALKLAQEVEATLRGSAPEEFFKAMYGNQPDQWDDNLKGMARLRCITNYLTRMRFCHPDGRLDFTYDGALASKPVHVMPWYEVPQRVNTHAKIIFGHWAALGGLTSLDHVYALDTGCVWGNCLTALRLEDEQRFSVQCEQMLALKL